MDKGVALMMTLSNKISKEFEPAVADFLSRDEFTKENFEANRKTLDEVFTMLHREGLLKSYKALRVVP